MQVLEKLDALQSEREKLRDHWKRKKSWLETIYLEQIFYRDVSSMDKTSSSQEVGEIHIFVQRRIIQDHLGEQEFLGQVIYIN